MTDALSRVSHMEPPAEHVKKLMGNKMIEPTKRVPCPVRGEAVKPCGCQDKFSEQTISKAAEDSVRAQKMAGGLNQHNSDWFYYLGFKEGALWAAKRREGKG